MNLFQLRKTAEARSGQNIAISKVAENVGVSRQQYWMYEKGQATPNFTIIRPLVAFFCQWLPELTDAEMINILEETRNKHAHAA